MCIAVKGATCSCSFGLMPTDIQLMPANVKCNNQCCVREWDANSLMNKNFQKCFCPSNPSVRTILNTIIIPGDCTPIIPTMKWNVKKNNVKIEGQAVCSLGDTCNCIYGGQISIIFPAQMNVK